MATSSEIPTSATAPMGEWLDELGGENRLSSIDEGFPANDNTDYVTCLDPTHVLTVKFGVPANLVQATGLDIKGRIKTINSESDTINATLYIEGNSKGTKNLATSFNWTTSTFNLSAWDGPWWKSELEDTNTRVELDIDSSKTPDIRLSAITMELVYTPAALPAGRRIIAPRRVVPAARTRQVGHPVAFADFITYSTTRRGHLTTVTAHTNRRSPVYWHWYIDGQYVGQTSSNTRSFYMQEGDQVRVEAIATNDPNFDGRANAPEGWPARRTLWWIRSLDESTARYRVEQWKLGGSWTEIANIPRDGNAWTYSILSPRLTDLAWYRWRVIPVDEVGNDGTALMVRQTPWSVWERIVRTPDAPDFTATLDSGTQKVTFAAV